MNEPSQRPLVGLTMGDVAGIGPEVIVRGWLEPRLHDLARPLVIGDPAVLERALALVGSSRPNARPDRRRAGGGRPFAAGHSRAWPSAANLGDLSQVAPGIVDARAGRAAYEFLTTAARLAMEGRIDAITTLPLNKMALHQSGVSHPGHTEILAEFCGVADHAMMLYLETNASNASGSPAPPARRGTGLGVVHVTLHVALKRVFELMTTEAVLAKIRLADRAMRPLTGGLPPRIAVSALNPHAGEDGLFGDEEQTIISPAVDLASREGIDVAGPFPNDTLFHHALAAPTTPSWRCTTTRGTSRSRRPASTAPSM